MGRFPETIIMIKHSSLAFFFNAFQHKSPSRKQNACRALMRYIKDSDSANVPTYIAYTV